MKRIVLALALCASLIGSAHAQGGMGPGPGTVHSTGGGGGFVGAGDLTITATVQAYWGLRAWTSATRGNKLINACNSTGGTDVGCGDMFSDATTGILASATIGGITCPGANCTVKTIYDISGQTNCSSAVCDLTQATVANRPTLGISGVNSRPCMQFTAASSQSLVNSTNFAPVSATQPFTVSYVADRTGATGAIGNVIESGASIQIGFFSSANTIFEYAGGSVASLGSVTDSTFHAVQNILNGASSVIYVDGSSNSVSAGANPWGSILTMGGSAGTGNKLTACVTEVSIWHGGFSSGDNSTVNANQHGSSGWNF